MTSMLAGVELGGTKCICILGTGPGDIAEKVELPTTTPTETLAAILAVLSGWEYQAIGIASFGPLDLDPQSPTYGSVVNSTKNLWSGASLLPIAAGKPFALDTDVNGAALAEGIWGAARGLQSWAYITIGTGIGVGSITDRQPLRGLNHSEAGHQRIPRIAGDSFKGICIFHGDCVEGLTSGPAIEARAGRQGREIAVDDPAWDYAAHGIAMLCHNLVMTTLPQRILLGGGVPTGQAQFLPLAQKHLVDSLNGFGSTGVIAENISQYLILAGLGADAGPLGALALAQQAAPRSAN